jgi:hypothetical protein
MGVQLVLLVMMSLLPTLEFGDCKSRISLLFTEAIAVTVVVYFVLLTSILYRR